MQAVFSELAEAWPTFAIANLYLSSQPLRSALHSWPGGDL